MTQASFCWRFVSGFVVMRQKIAQPLFAASVGTVVLLTTRNQDVMGSNPADRRPFFSPLNPISAPFNGSLK